MSDTKKIKINPNIFKIAQKTNKTKTIKAYQPVSPKLLRNKFIQNVLKKRMTPFKKTALLRNKMFHLLQVKPIHIQMSSRSPSNIYRCYQMKINIRLPK